MALDTAFYLVTKDIAQRAGLEKKRYVTTDGRYILDNKDLSRVRFTTDEYISGLEGVEKISASDAKTLIAQGGYQLGGTYTMGATDENTVETNENQEQEEE